MPNIAVIDHLQRNDMQYNRICFPSVCLMALPPGLLESTHVQMKRCKKRDVPESAERREVRVGQLTSFLLQMNLGGLALETLSVACH